MIFFSYYRIIIIYTSILKGSFLLAGAFLALQGFCGMSLGFTIVCHIINNSRKK